MTSPVIERPQADPHMQANLHAVGQMNQYIRWIYDSIAPYLGESIFEAGCGNGNLTLPVLQRPGIRRYVGIDVDAGLCEQLRSKLAATHSHMDWAVHSWPLESPELDTLESARFDTIICLNVLEHVEDDQAVLNRFRRLLRPGGKLILLVPAFQWLYGSIDEVVHHKRRYHKPALDAHLRKAGFHIQKLHYFNFFGMAAWYWHGKVLKLRVHKENDMRSWDRWVWLLSAFEKYMPIPAGLSLFAVAENPS